MLLGFVTSAVQGEGELHYRVLSPAQALSELPGVFAVVGREDSPQATLLAALADILVLHMVPGGENGEWLDKRRADGFPTVLEVSDDIASPSGYPAWDEYLALLRLPLLQAAVRADALQFPSTALQERFNVPGIPSVVFPNQMIELPPLRMFRRHKPAVVGWGGSLTHLPEMARLAPALEAWASTRENVALSIMAADDIQGMFRGDTPVFLRREPGTVKEYYHFLDQLDIGLAPLADTPFNQARTDIKFLEYASRGVAVVAQDAAPYRNTVRHGQNGFLFHDDSSLFQALDELVADPLLRIQLCTAAYDYVDRERRETRHTAQRWDFYRRLVKSPRPAAENRFMELCSTEGPTPGPRLHIMED